MRLQDTNNPGHSKLSQTKKALVPSERDRKHVDQVGIDRIALQISAHYFFIIAAPWGARQLPFSLLKPNQNGADLLVCGRIRVGIGKVSRLPAGQKGFESALTGANLLFTPKQTCRSE
jgi:hypothetical protein